MANLHDKAALCDLLLATIPDYAVFLMNRDGIVMEWNQAVGQMFGYTEQDVVGQHISLIFTEEDNAGGLPWQELQTAMDNGKAVGPHWYRRKNGTPLFVDGLVVPLRPRGSDTTQILKIVRNITPHHLVGGLLNPMTEGLEDPVFLKDRSGRFVFVTDSAASLLGCGKEDAVYRTASDLWPEGIAHRWIEADKFVVREGMGVEFEETILVNGAERIYSFRQTPWRNLDNKIVGLVAIGRDVTHHRRLEAEARHLVEGERDLLTRTVQSTSRKLDRSQQQIHNLAIRLWSAQEDEQRRIAREMHDNLSQRLAVLGFGLTMLQRQVAEATPLVGADVGKLVNSVEDIAEDVRNLSHRLHPAILEDLGLVPALRSLCDEFAHTYNMLVRSTFDVVFSEPIPLPVSTALYRIAQEALSNTVKHAGRASVVVELVGSDSEGELHLSVADAGPGFDFSSVESRGGGLGLVSMQERARLVGGILEVNSLPGAGTQIAVAVSGLKPVMAQTATV